MGGCGRKRIKTNLEETNNPTNGSLFETNQNYSFGGPTSNIFMSPPSFQHSYRMYEDLNNCNNYYGSYQNPYIFNPCYAMMPASTMSMGYPMFCMPYQPLITLDMYQQR